MSSSIDFIEYVCRQIAPAGVVRYRFMFGDYLIYVNEKPVILASENQAYVKMHPAIEALMRDAERGYPYEGAKEHYLLDVSHPDTALQVVKVLQEVLPYPKKRSTKA